MGFCRFLQSLWIFGKWLDLVGQGVQSGLQVEFRLRAMENRPEPRWLVPAVGTVQAAANPCDNGSNPCVAPWTDYTTPVQYLWWFGYGNNPPTMNTVLANPSVTATTATFWLNTFKPNVTLTVYYGTAAPGACNLNN